MLQLVGVSHNIELSIRERFSIIQKHQNKFIDRLLDFCDEAVILSTCNRTEIYFNAEDNRNNIIKDIFEALDWDYTLREYTFYKKGRDASGHLMDVACGLDSIVLGEDQILGQIKSAYEKSIECKGLGKELQRLFETAMACGKEFRHETGISSIPVSSSSIIIKQAVSRGIKKFMIMGYGEIGQLTAKYVLEEDFEVLYIVVRDLKVVDLEHNKVKVINFTDAKELYKEVDCIITCTSAPHSIIRKEDLPDKDFLIFDLAVPRNVEEEVMRLSNVELVDIDKVTIAHNENLEERKKIMDSNKHIAEKYTKEFLEWESSREVKDHIRKFKEAGDIIYRERFKTFTNKKNSKDPEVLAKMLLKSTSDAYVNKAIEVLKEEHLKGRGEECLRILEKIFQI